MLEKYTLDENDFEYPGFGKGLMKRFVTAKDLSFRAGFEKNMPGAWPTANTIEPELFLQEVVSGY